MRVYVPATLTMLRQLVDDEQLQPLGGTAFALTAALRESYASGDTEELEYAAMREAARASLRLLATDDPDTVESGGGESSDSESDGTDGGSAEAGSSESDREAPRRVVLSADVAESTPRPDLDHAVVKIAGPVTWHEVAAVHVDTAEAEKAVRVAANVIDAADLGDSDAEFLLGEAEDHELAWYAPQEVPFLLDLM